MIAVVRSRAAPLTLGLAAALGCAYLSVADPNDPDAVFPVCPTRAVTGLDCPACGGLRMTHALLRGDLAGAASANLLLLLLAPLAVVGWVGWLRRGGSRPPLLTPAVNVALLAGAVAYAVVRNVV